MDEKDAFRVYDIDGSGGISAEELSRISEGLGECACGGVGVEKERVNRVSETDRQTNREGEKEREREKEREIRGAWHVARPGLGLD